MLGQDAKKLQQKVLFGLAPSSTYGYTEMYRCHYYRLFEPWRSEFVDNPSRQPAFETKIHTEAGTSTVALFLDADGRPEAVRTIVTGLEEEELPEDALSIIQQSHQHMLSILWMSYSRSTRFSIVFYAFFKDDAPHDINLGLEAKYEEPHLDVSAVQLAFASTFGERQQIRLLLEGTDESLPLEHRYLSLFKIIEHDFRILGEWKKNEILGFFEPYATEIGSLNLPRPLMSQLYYLRDICAHIKVSNDQVPGATALNQAALQELTRMVPVLAEVCTDIANKNASGQYRIGRPRRVRAT